MANLVLDIGNTRTKMALFEGSALVEQKYVESLQADDIESICKQFCVKKCIASVVGKEPDFERILPDSLKSFFHRLTAKSKMPIKIDYDTPGTLGMDRVAAAAGAVGMSPGKPLLVIDAGSCITIDFVDENAVYHGGAILPGLRMKFRSLHDYTQALPLVDADLAAIGDCHVAGRNTEQSILAGVATATLYEIRGFIEHYEKAYSGIKVFLTGGDSVFFANKYIFPNFAVPALVLWGLNNILEMNV